MPPKKSVVSALRMRKPSRQAPDAAAVEAFVSSGSVAPQLDASAPKRGLMAVVAAQTAADAALSAATDFVCIGLDEAIQLKIPHISVDAAVLVPDAEAQTPCPTSDVVPARPDKRRRSRDKAASVTPASSETAEPAEAEATDEPATAEEWIEQAIDHLQAGDVLRALLGFGKAVRLAPANGTAYAHRAVARERIGNLDGALSDYNEAIRLDPRQADAFYNRGNAYQTIGNLAQAIADYDEAIRLDPHAPLFFNNRGNARFEQGDSAGALSDYDQAIRLDRQFAFAYHNRGNVRCSRGDLKGAMADFRRYLDLGGGVQEGDQVEVEQLIGELQAELKSTG